MNNEQGFVLPITLFVIFLVSSYVTFQLNQYMIEKELIYEQGQLYTNERLLQMAIKDLNEIITERHSDFFSGNLNYENGDVTFFINRETDEIKSITLVSKTLEQRTKQIKYYYYLNNETVLPWMIE